MEKPHLLHVVYKNKQGKTTQRSTNDENTAFKWKVIFNGEVYIDTRYKARLRLYNHINRIK